MYLLTLLYLGGPLDVPPLPRVAGRARSRAREPSPSCCSLHGRSRASSLPARRPCASACPNAACGTGVGLCRGWTVRLSEHGPSLGAASRAPRTTPHPCRAAVDSLAHSAELPSALVARVPQREKLILSFVLAFIKDQAPPHAAPALCPRPRPRLCPSPSRLPSPLPPPPPPPSPSPSPAPSARALRPQPSPRRSDLSISPRACRRSCS